MKLYAFLSADRGGVSKGSNTKLEIVLQHELNDKDWRNMPDYMNKIKLDFRYNDGKPTLLLQFPKGWTEDKEEKNILYEYRGEEKKANKRHIIAE